MCKYHNAQLKYIIVLYVISLDMLKYPVLGQTTAGYATVDAFFNENRSSCEEFVNNTEFNPAKVVDVDWKIFFFWNPQVEESYNIKFSRPSEMLVDRFRVELDSEMKVPVNWTDAELFMETSIDFSALFVKTEKPGIYRVIPASAFDYHAVPTLIFALKLAEPNILGILNCKYRVCYALAPVDKMPHHYELEKAAALLQFRSQFNRTHIAMPEQRTTGVPYAMDTPVDSQEEDLEVEHHQDKMNFF